MIRIALVFEGVKLRDFFMATNKCDWNTPRNNLRGLPCHPLKQPAKKKET